MATLHSVQSGDFTTSTTWGLVNATSAVLTYTSQGFPGTTPTASPTFTPGVITVQGISIHISNRSTSAIGTFTVQLFNATTTIVVASVTINATDLFNNNGSTNNPLGWVYFKFDTPVTTVAAQLYSVRLINSNGNQVSVNFLTTAQNWTKVLVTTTNQVPAATDVLIISGQHTAAGVSATYSVTMNSTSNATAYGNLFVSSKGTLIYGTASSTNYSLRLAGNLLVHYSGTLQIGSVTDPIPATSTATLEILCTTALQFTIVVLGTMTTYGSPKTIDTKLAANVIVGATNSTTSTTTNWRNGDLIVVPSTTRTYTQYELKTLSATASGTTLTHNAYTNAHGGSVINRVQADVVNLTRNVIIRSATGTLLTNKTNIQMRDPSITSFFYTAFLALGTGTTTLNSGICVATLNSGSFNFQYNVVREIVTQAATTTAATGLQTDNTTTGITISNNIFYLIGWTSTVVSSIIASINDNNYFMGCLATTQIINANFAGSGNVFTSNNTPASIAAFYNNSSNCSFYSNNTAGLAMTLSSSLTTVNNNLSNFRFWANNTNGMQLITSATTYGRTNILSFTGSYFFGNTTSSIIVLTRLVLKLYFSNSFFYGFAGATGQQTIHYIGTAIPVDSIYYDSCYFGYSDSALTSAPFGGVNLSLPTSSTYQLFSNCYFNTANGELSVLAGYPYTNLYGGYRSLNHNGVTGSNKEWTHSGTITTDKLIYLSGTQSTRLTPSNPVYELVSPIVRVPVKSGSTCTVSVQIKRSILVDGAVYNGNLPRLMYAFNPVLDNFTETIGSTFPSITNLLSSPEDFDNASWGKFFSASITANTLVTLAPDNTNSSDIFNTAAGSTTPLIARAPNSVAGSTYSLSIYVKSGTNNFFQIRYISNGTLNSYVTSIYNTTLGTITQTALGSTGGTLISNSITSVGNGWFRLALVASIPQSDLNVGFTMVKNGTGNLFGGNGLITNGSAFSGTENMYIWGTLLEQSSITSTYISQGGWQTLSYTTATFSSDGVAEFYVDCDGTAGWINIDDWNTTTANDSRGQDYWGVSGVYIEPTYRKPTRASGYIS
jgi:hypothetical protein